jgi:hypothetical protein
LYLQTGDAGVNTRTTRFVPESVPVSAHAAFSTPQQVSSFAPVADAPIVTSASQPVMNHQSTDAGLHSGLSQLVDFMNLPKASLMQFNGNPLDFYLFLNTFDSVVGNSSVPDSAK